MLQAASERKPRNDVGLEQWALYAGRLAPVKGIEPLLESAKRIHDSFPNVTFVFAGPWQMPRPPEMYDLELNRRSKHGVLWIGPQQPRQLIEWYRRANLFVMPSYYESFGIGVVEAMAFGFPVIATRAGGLPEVVEDGVTGILVQPGDSEGLADAIIHLLREPGLRRRMGEAGRQRALDQFTVDRVLARTISVYDAIVRN
jgi:starch synthase